MRMCIVYGILHEGSSDSLATMSRIGDDGTDTAGWKLRRSHTHRPFMKNVASELFPGAKGSPKLLRAVFRHGSDILCPVLDAARRGVGGECLIRPVKMQFAFG